MRRNSNGNSSDDDRPSLFGDDFALDAPTSAKRNGPQPVSMLAGLGARRPQPTAGRRPFSPFWWAGGGLLLAVAMAVYLQTAIGLAVNPFRAAGPDAPDRTLVRPPAVKTAAPAPVATAPAPAPLAARLEVLPSAALAQPARPAQQAQPTAKPASAVTVASPRVPVVPPASGAKPAIDVAPASAGAASAASTLRVARAAPVQPVQSAAKPIDAARPAGSNPVGNDADVDLLAALMSHPNLAARAAAASAPRVPAALAGAPSTGATAKAPAPAGAAVADAKPRVDLSIATLVRDCTARADKQEALACRRRICEGYWGKAQACPRELQGPPGQSSGPVLPTAGKDKT
jgi:hypothetical protein